MLENRTLDGYESRNSAMFKIADALGISYVRGLENKQLDKIYRDLSTVFKADDTLPIGTGKTGRLRQAPVKSLYQFAKNQYNVEVSEWNNPEEVNKIKREPNEDIRFLSIINSFLNKLDEGKINADEFTGVIRGIIASYELDKDLPRR